MTGKAFASTDDTVERKISFDQIGAGLYALTAEGDPNSGIVVGDDAVLVIDAQPTPAMADDLIARVAKITDKPIKYVLLTHHHAVRTLGASAFKGAEIIASDVTRGLIAERGQQDMESEIGRLPRLFRAAETIPGLTWPTVTFPDQISIWLGRREVRIMHIGRGHTAGDVIAVVPDAGVGVRRRSGRIQIRLLLRRCAYRRMAGGARSSRRNAAGCAGAGPRRRADHAGAGGGGPRAHHRFSIDALRLGARERRQGPLAERRLRFRAAGDGSDSSSRSGSTSTACRSTSCAPTTRRAASIGR